MGGLEDLICIMNAVGNAVYKRDINKALAENDISKAKEICKSYIATFEKDLKRSKEKDSLIKEEDTLNYLKEAYTTGISLARKAGNADYAAELEQKLNALPK